MKAYSVSVFSEWCFGIQKFFAIREFTLSKRFYSSYYIDAQFDPFLNSSPRPLYSMQFTDIVDATYGCPVRNSDPSSTGAITLKSYLMANRNSALEPMALVSSVFFSVGSYNADDFDFKIQIATWDAANFWSVPTSSEVLIISTTLEGRKTGSFLYDFTNTMNPDLALFDNEPLALAYTNFVF
jgi:hypothetical protein